MRTARRPLLAAALVAMVGCGADTDAPSPTNAPAPATCPPLAEIAPITLGLVRDRQLPNLQRLLGETLDKQQVAALLDGLLRALRDLGPRDLDGLFALTRDPRLAALTPLLLDVLRYLGDPSGARDGLLVETVHLLRTCDGGTLFRGVEALIDAPQLPPLLADLGAVIALPIVQDLLDADLAGALSREGFTALVCNIASALTRPGFSVRSDVITPLSGIDLLPLGEPPLSTFLDALDGLLDPNGAALPALADVICCDLYGASRCADVPADAVPRAGDPVYVWALYDLFIGAGGDLSALLDQLGGLIDDPALGAALAPLRGVLSRLAEDPDLRRALVEVLAAALRPEVARGVLPEVTRLLEAGTVGELLALIDALRGGCDPGALQP